MEKEFLITLPVYRDKACLHKIESNRIGEGGGQSKRSNDPKLLEATNVAVAQLVAALDVTPRSDVTVIEAKQPVELVVTEEPAWVELLRAASADRRWVEVPDDRDAADRNRPGVLMMVASLAQ